MYLFRLSYLALYKTVFGVAPQIAAFIKAPAVSVFNKPKPLASAQTPTDEYEELRRLFPPDF